MLSPYATAAFAHARARSIDFGGSSIARSIESRLKTPSFAPAVRVRQELGGRHVQPGQRGHPGNAIARPRRLQFDPAFKDDLELDLVPECDFQQGPQTVLVRADLAHLTQPRAGARDRPDTFWRWSGVDARARYPAWLDTRKSMSIDSRYSWWVSTMAVPPPNRHPFARRSSASSSRSTAAIRRWCSSAQTSNRSRPRGGREERLHQVALGRASIAPGLDVAPVPLVDIERFLRRDLPRLPSAAKPTAAAVGSRSAESSGATSTWVAAWFRLALTRDRAVQARARARPLRSGRRRWRRRALPSRSDRG